MIEKDGVGFMRQLYGFSFAIKGVGFVNAREAEIVNLIFTSYLSGHSLGGVVKLLQQKEIASPSGKAVWGRAAIDKLLSNPNYRGSIIEAHLYDEVQREKQSRCNLVKTDDGVKRKNTHYSSKSIAKC